jgi:hypothetical protein
MNVQTGVVRVFERRGVNVEPFWRNSEQVTWFVKAELTQLTRSEWGVTVATR